ncbi:TetR/AcrR family transcriptional regulator [Pseudonocardia lacus]|uniref:TetR/AcrR family transcriptional regulator n=1 Tax=Pseudonocardia lacus TaxID=2835865 RepID=UPI001BDD3D54|nr:TetR/AcrR family transcriptional regulator [Pseudonocardia lacus]
MVDHDRRVRRTRRALHEALIALVLERGYDRLTVQDVLDRADVGRSTFYAHYRDKEALLTATFDDMRAQLQRDVDAQTGGDPLDPARPAGLLFAHAHRNQRVYRALCGREGGTVVLRHLHRMLAEVLTTQLGPHLPAGSPVPIGLVVEFCTSAALGLLVRWIDDGFPDDPRTMTAGYRALCLPGVRAVAGGLVADEAQMWLQ